jgi:hypothetical protein
MPEMRKNLLTEKLITVQNADGSYEPITLPAVIGRLAGQNAIQFAASAASRALLARISGPVGRDRHRYQSYRGASRGGG